MSKTNLHHHVFIDALPSKVWKVLTSRDYTDQYLPDGNVHSHWTEGSPITSKNQTENTVTVDRGIVLQVVPGVVLRYKLFENDSDTFTTMAYEVVPAENGLELKLHTECFIESEEEYFARLKEAKLLLQKIKWLAEYA